MLQIGTALFYCKLGQTLLQIGGSSLLQIRASDVTNWGSYYKLGQLLLQNRVAITNWGQIRAIITNWGITTSASFVLDENLLNSNDKCAR